MRHLVRRTPRACGIDQPRWTLAAIGTAGDWLSERTSSCVHRMLKRFGLVWKRARAAVRSPAPRYAAKLAVVEQVRAKAAAHAGRIVGVSLDEGTIERQPRLANDYAEQGRAQPRAERSHSADTLTRVIAALHAQTAQVTVRRASTITLATLVQVYQDRPAAYPAAERI